MRGQAFVIFENEMSSFLAKENLDNHIFFGKEMKIEFSKTISNLKEKGRKYEKTEMNSVDYMENMKNIEVQSELTTESNVLFVKNLPNNVKQSLIDEIFQVYDGFYSSKLRNGYAIVTYNSVENAVVAYKNTSNKKISDGIHLKVEYSR